MSPALFALLWMHHLPVRRPLMPGNFALTMHDIVFSVNIAGGDVVMQGVHGRYYFATFCTKMSLMNSALHFSL